MLDRRRPLGFCPAPIGENKGIETLLMPGAVNSVGRVALLRLEKTKGLRRFLLLTSKYHLKRALLRLEKTKGLRPHPYNS